VSDDQPCSSAAHPRQAGKCRDADEGAWSALCAVRQSKGNRGNRGQGNRGQTTMGNRGQTTIDFSFA
jgi:hypothetical protein